MSKTYILNSIQTQNCNKCNKKVLAFMKIKDYIQTTLFTIIDNTNR